MNDIPNQKEWDKYVNELKACRDGKQGWVRCSKGRAIECGLPHDQLVKTAEILGLSVTRHGRYGYTASRRT